MNPHTTNDDTRRYRLGSEAETWKLKDPIARVKAYLLREANVGTEFFAELEQESKKLAEHVRAGCRALPNPTPESVFQNVYVDVPDELLKQRGEFVDFVSSIEEVNA
jgi:pyruvate dehydrogenase E1 component alpha subunit